MYMGGFIYEYYYNYHFTSVYGFPRGTPSMAYNNNDGCSHLDAVNNGGTYNHTMAYSGNTLPQLYHPQNLWPRDSGEKSLH